MASLHANTLNSSKPLQLANILSLVSNYNSILFPDTKIIKDINIENIILPEGSKVITLLNLCLSGIRSIVINQDEFSMWIEDGLSVLPTIFQKQIRGNDVRVHVCHDQIFAVRISNKDRVDYRYSEPSFFKETTLPPEGIKFCLATSYLEKNPLIGIDLIKTTDGYVFLESNPMPGWAYFFKKDASKEKVCCAIMGTT